MRHFKMLSGIGDFTEVDTNYYCNSSPSLLHLQFLFILNVYCLQVLPGVPTGVSTAVVLIISAFTRDLNMIEKYLD